MTDKTKGPIQSVWISKADLGAVLATGYSRVTLDNAKRGMSEVQLYEAPVREHQTRDFEEMVDWLIDCGVPIPPTADIDKLARAFESFKAFQRAVEDELVIHWEYRDQHSQDPRMAVSDLLNASNAFVLDPLISKDAQQLIAKGRREGIEGVARALQDLPGNKRWFSGEVAAFVRSIGPTPPEQPAELDEDWLDPDYQPLDVPAGEPQSFGPSVQAAHQAWIDAGCPSINLEEPLVIDGVGMTLGQYLDGRAPGAPETPESTLPPTPSN